MNVYGLKIIDMTNVTNVDEHLEAARNTNLIEVVGLKALFERCGGKLKRERCGYSGRSGNWEYQAVKMGVAKR